MERFDDLDDQLDDAGGREELAALLPLRHGELAEEVFVNLAEGVAFDRHRDGRRSSSAAKREGFSRDGCTSWGERPSGPHSRLRSPSSPR